MDLEHYKTERFVKKPTEIEALQWFGTDDEDYINKMIEFLTFGQEFQFQQDPNSTSVQMTRDTFVLTIYKSDHLSGASLIIKTLEGQMLASPGDYVIKGIKNEFYPCKSDIFELTYDKVEV